MKEFQLPVFQQTSIWKVISIFASPFPHLQNTSSVGDGLEQEEKGTTLVYFNRAGQHVPKRAPQNSDFSSVKPQAFQNDEKLMVEMFFKGTCP